MINGIEKLEFLTQNLPNGIPTERISAGVSELKAKNGFGFLFNLIHLDKIAVVRGVFSKESEYEVHIHTEKEWLLIYRGIMEVTLLPVEGRKEEVHLLKEGDLLYIEPERSHRSRALENCEFIAITIPASKGFPDDK